MAMREELKPFTVTVKRSRRARVTHVWTRYSASIEEAVVAAAQAVADEFGREGIVVSVYPAVPKRACPWDGAEVERESYR